MFMLKARSRVVDGPGVVWALTRSLLFVAVMLALLVPAGVAYAQGTPTAPTIESVAVTSDPGVDGGYAIGDEIQVGLTFSEAVTVTGAPQLTLDVGGRNRTAEYSEGSTTTRLLFTYTVASGDEDTDGIAVVANSLALNGGAIRAGSTNAALTHAALQAHDHKVDGIAPTVTVGGETRTYVPPGRQFNVVFYFSEKVYGITDAEITVNNGEAHDVQATGGNATWPKYTRWDVIIVPAAEGPVTVTLQAGAATDAYGNGNAAPDSALEVIAATPVTVEVARTTSGFAEGGKAEFTVTRSGDNGAIPVSLSLAQTGDLLSGAVEVYPPADPNNPDEPVTPQEFTFTETPFNLNVTFAAGETSKRIAVPTEDDSRDEDDGTVTLSVPARPDQYKYIPGPASSATADVRDNDEPFEILMTSDSYTPLSPLIEGEIAKYLLVHSRISSGLTAYLEFTEGLELLDLGGAGSRGYEHVSGGRIRVELRGRYTTFSVPTLEDETIGPGGRITLVGQPGDGYFFSEDWINWTYRLSDDDSPPSVTLAAPVHVTEGDEVRYTITRTSDAGQSRAELTVNVQLAQTGDYITWPTAHQPDADGLVTIPVNFAARSLTATLTLETVDDQMSEDNGSVTATILADAGGSYVTGADSDHTTKLLDNDPPIISVAAVSAKVTEGTDAQFRFSRSGNTSVATRVGLWVGGLPKIMTDATDAIALTADNADLSQRLHIYGAWVDYILEFAAGETEKTLSLTTEADNVNEGDGLLGVTIVQRVGNPFGIGAGYAQVHIHDDDIPTVTISQVTLPTGAATLEGDTWVGELGEVQPLSWVVSCSGNYEYSPLLYNPSVSGLPVQVENIRLANHPAYYGGGTGWELGRNILGYVWGGICDGQAQTSANVYRVVGPDGGVETFKLVPKDRAPSIVAEYRERYRQAKAAADAAGTLVTQPDIIHEHAVRLPHTLLINCHDEPRYCPQYRVGTPHKIRLTLVNRDPTILIKAESTTVEEGQAARFIVERLWHDALLRIINSGSETVVALRAAQNGQYITGALPTEITFGRNETSKTIELATVDDAAFGENGSVTIDLLPDTTGADLNIAGKYETFEHWAGHTPEGARSDRATIAITNNDDKPGITIAPAWALEGDSGSADMTFTVTLAKAVTEAVTINYATSDGTAIAGRDYTAVSNGSVTIAAGNTTAEFTVSMTGDETDELDETFNVTISMPEPEPDLNGGSSGEPVAAITGGDTAAAAGTILDDDPAVVTVAPKVDTVEEGEAAVFVLTRAGMTNGRLAMQVRLRSPGRLQMLDARFEPGAVTTEIAVATYNNNLVDYPSVRDYTIEVFGDGAHLGQDDRSFTPGAPATATVKVTDDDELINVTVYPVKAIISHGNPYWIFRRDGDISQPLSALFGYYLHKSDRSRTEITYGATARFEAGQDEVVLTYHDYDFVEDIEYPAEDKGIFPITLTYTVFGDGGQYGLHRIYQGGNPNTATVTMEYNGYERRLVVGAEAPLWVSVGQTVNIPLMVTNAGSLDSGTPITITSTHYSEDRLVNGTNEPRMTCQFDGPIAAGESAGCEVSFLVLEKDLSWRNGAEIELDVVASDGRTTSNAFRIFMRVRNGVSVGFKETANLLVTEPGFGEDNASANLTVTRVGQSGEEVQVAYTLEPWPTGFRSYSPVEGVDYADNSTTPGVITFGENETEKTITIDILGDQIDEAKEQFLVTLVPPEGVLVEEDKRTRIVVINDTNPPPGESYRPTASLQLVSSGPVPESEGPVEFAIVLDREWGIDALYEVELIFDQLTATPGIARLGKKGDFEDPGVLVVRIPAGQTRFEFSIPLYDDDVREEDETFKLLLGSSIDKSFRTIGPSNTALATIADDDRIPPTEVALSLSHRGSALASVPEGSNRRKITVTASFAQVRWPGDPANAILHPADPLDVDTTVRVQVDPNSGATHAAGLEDFEPLRMEDALGEFQVVESFDIVIPAGQTSGNATVGFWPVKDDVDEQDETVTLQGSEVVAGNPEDSLPVRSASFTIIDDDTRGITLAPRTALSGLSLVEGGEPGTYSLVLDSQPTDTVVITLAGNQGGFLRLVPDTLTFTSSDWATPQTISVIALDDGIAGGAGPLDIINHQVSGGDYGNVTAPDILTIIEDTTKAFVYLEGGQASESDGHVEFTVTVRPILRTTPVLVRYATVDGTAIAGSDYTREVETGQAYKILNIPAGQSSGAIRIPITDDEVYESADETFSLQLTNHNNQATLDGSATSLTATGAIADDDPKPVVSVAGPAGDMSYVSENAKDPVTFTLTLMGQSAGDVIVDYATGEAGLLGLLTSRQGSAGATENEDYAGTSGSVTFTSGQTTKTVTVQVTNDDVSEETEFFGFKISKPQGADLRGQRSEDVADVGVLDDDARGVTIDPTSISLDEPASGETAVADSYTVNLKSRPTDTVTVTIGGGDPAVSLSGDTLTNNQLTFTTTNWNTAQTITVTPVKDDNAVGETVTLTHTLSGGDYAGIAADSVTINLTDSDTRNVVLSRPSLTLTEGDAAGTSYTVALATKPSGEVTVTISGQASTDVTLSGTTLISETLTFTVDDWNVAQTVTVKAAHDDDGSADTATLTHTASGGGYTGRTRDLPVTVTDDDSAGVTIEPTALSVVTGRTNKYSVKLATEPTGDVTVTISGHASTDVTPDKTTLTFTVDNWDTAQTVTVSATQNAATAKVTLAHAVAGADYGSVTADSVVVSVVAVAAQQSTLQVGVSSSTQTLTVPEGGSNSYALVLSSRPTGDVAVGVTLPTGSDLTLSSDMLTFTVDNWDDAQTVTVTAAEDDDGVTDAGVTLTHTISGGGYGSTTVPDVEVSITENDSAGLVISKDNLMVGEGDAAGTSYTVALATEPSGSVTVSITGHAGTDLTLDKTTLTFTVDNWDTAQTVTVKAGQDDDGANDAATLTHTASGGDYVNVTKDLPVTVTDDDTADIVLSKTDLAVTEGDAAGSSYTVKLATQPSGSATVTISGQASTDLSLSGTTLSSNMLTFTVDNWATAQTVTVKAGQDEDAANDTATLTHTASGGDYVNVTEDLPVTVTDDDTADIVLSKTDLAVTEGDAAGSSYTVKLATQPSGSATVTISGHDGTDLSLSGTTLSSDTLTFTVDNWATAQTVTVKAGQDEDAVNDTATLTHTASGGDYVNVTEDLPVTVTDDDTADIVLSKTGLTVTEGDVAGTSYTVALATKPSGEVTVTISGQASTDLSLSGTTLSSDTLTFTVDDWATAQTVTVKAGHDDDAANDTATLTHTASGGDYVNVTEDLTVTVTDDDSADIVLSKTDLAVTEGDAVGSSYTVKLATRPSGTVSVSITGHASTDLSLSGTTLSSNMLTFTVDDWATAQTVTVKAGQDEDAANDTATLTHTASGGDYVNVTEDLPVTVTDDDTADIVLSKTDLAVTEGDAAGSSYTVKLATKPSGSVTVSITGHAGTDLTLDKTTLTFTVDDWATAQTVTVKAGQDEDGSADTATLTHTASGGGYTGRTRDLLVTVTDNDTPAVTIEPTALSVVTGRSNKYSVKLATEPTGEVTVTISGHASTDVTLDKTTLTFTVDNWDTAQTVTVSATQNAATAKVTLAHAVAGADYGSVTADSVVVSVVAVAAQQSTLQVGVSSSTQTLTVPEGGSNSYALVLSSRPTGDVAIGVTLPTGSDLTLSSDMLTFTVDNWDDAQTVTVTAAEDDDGVTDAVATLTHTISGGGYASTTVPNLEVSITENDTPAVTIEPTALSVVTGRTNKYSVKLATEPTGDVTVTISGHASTDVTLDKTTLTFTTDNWDTAQTVTVSATQNAATAKVTLAHTVAGADYGSVTAEPVVVSVVGVAGQQQTIQVGVSSSTQTLTVPEGGANSYTLVLGSRPTGDVAVGVTLPTGTDLTLDKTTLTFTSTNWDVAQTVTVTAAEDDDGVTDAGVTLTHTVSGGGYGSTTVPDVEVSITENDTAGLVLSKTGLTVTEGDAAGSSYTVKLATRPSGSVSVTISGHDGADLSLSGTTLSSNQLTFTVDDWNAAQTVTVKAGHDDDGAADTAALTHTAFGGDYVNVTKDLPVSITDDEVPVTVQFGATTYEVVEGETVTVAVTLSADPERTVVIPLTHTPQGNTTSTDYSGVPANVTFSTGDMSQTITFTATQDDVDDGGKSVLLAFGTLPPAVSLGTTTQATVSITDDDGAGVSVSESSLTIAEGSSGTYTIVLDSQPTADVTVTINDPSNTDVTAEPAGLTFSSTDWNTPKTVTVNAAQDADAEDETATVTHAVTSTDSSYSGASANSVTVTITDDEVPVTVSFGQANYTVAEGDPVSVTVTLSADPERTVVIPLTHTPQGNTTSTDYSGVPANVTFSTGDMSQTITFTATQDDVDDGGKSVLLAFGTTLPGGVSLGTTTTTTVNITDDDGAGVTVSNNSLDITEGSSGTYTIVLDSQPTANVTVTINDPSNTDVTADPASLTFASTDWNSPKTVTVRAAQDADAENDTATVTHAVTSTDSIYSGASANNVTVTITDDEVPVTVSFGQANYTVAEGDPVTVAVTLSADPERMVVIPLTHTPQGSTTSADYSGVPANVTFSTGDMSQTITFTATQDDVDDGGKSVLLAFGTLPPAVSLGTTTQATVSITDDDGAGVSVSESSLTIAEGSSGTYTIVLDSQPTADVTVTINDPSNTDVTAEPAGLTFSSTDWNTPKTVTVRAAQDADAEDETATVTHAVTSTDSSYSGASANSVTVTITDDEVPVTVSFGQANYTVAEGDPVSVTVTLSADPERMVVIPLTHTPQGSTTSADYSGVPANVTFSTGDMSQTITFTATQDDVDDGGKSVLLAFGTTLPGGVSLGTTTTTTVNITDDDGAGVTVSNNSLDITEGSSGTYTIVLDSQPTADVTVTINDPSNTDVTAEPASLTFSSTDWNSPKTVTVNAAQDADAEDETATVTHAVTSTDSSYSGASANNVAVSVTDDEVPVTVQFGATTYTVAEGDPVTVAVTLSADPERTVVIPITHTPRSGAESPADYSGVPTSVTFNTGQMSKTIAFTAAQDDVDDDGESVLLAFGAPLPGGVSLGTTVTTTVSITDDDGAGVSVSESSLTIAEGSSGTYTIVLDSQPTADVAVAINDPSNTDVTAEPASLTFSSTDWNTPKTVTVNAAQDADAEDETATVTHAVTSTDSSYSGAPANSVAVSVTDDEVTVTVQFGATTYEVVEGETVTVAVTLSADPERTVVIPITHTPRSGAESPADYSVPQSVTFDAGEMSKTITFTAAQDDVDDDGESVLLAFGAPLPGGVSLGTTVTTTVSITDDDDPQVAVSFDRASYRVLEGDTVTVGVTLSGDPKRTVEIPLTATDYGGASSEDYSGVPSSVTINAGETSKTFEFMAMADDASDTGESVMIGFGTSLPSRVTEGTPNEARVNINQMSTQFSLDCSLTATVWCADLGFSDRVAENYGWLYMRYGHGWDPPSSLSDDDFRFRGVDYDVRSMELLAGTHPVMPNAWSTWQQGYSSFRIGIYWDHRWGAPSEEHYRDWVLHLDGLELPFKDALRHGSDFVWVGAEFQQVFNDWTPSTVTKIGIKEVAAADQDTNPLLPWAPMQVDAWPEGPDRLLIVWAKPASFYPGLPDPTSYTVQWKLASADWSDSAAVSQLEVAATSNFQAVIMNGMTEDAVYSVRVIASNDAGDGPPSEETLGRPQDSLPRLIARTVNRQTLNLRFSEQLDPNAVPAATNFVVKADGGLIMVDSVAISGDEVILTLHHAVTAATHSVLVRYDKPTDPSAVFLQDTNGNYANIRQHHELLEVANITPQSSVQPLTALFTNMPSSHDGRTRFTFDIEFSEPVWIGDGLARDDMLEITGGTVISAPWKDRRTDKFIVHVRPDTQGDIVIVLPGHRACHGIVGSHGEVPDPVAGAPCAIGSRVLTNEPTVTIPGPSSPAQQVVENTPAEGEPQINGIPEVGQTLSADTTAISDADGLENAVFQYQWLAEDADISGATGATYTVVSGDVGQAIRVSVAFTDDGGHEETLTSAPTAVVTVAGLQLQSATVDGSTLTLTYSEVLDTGVTLGTTPFAVNVNGSSRSLIGVGVGESNVLLLLSSAVEVGDTVTVDYTVPDGPDFIRDIRDRKAASFSGQAVKNDTASAPDVPASDPLTASVHNVPSSHNGQDAFTFEVRFSEEFPLSYATVRDHAFTVTGGSVTYVRRLDPPSNIRWEITVTPGSGADVTIALNATTDCSAQGAICTEDGGKLAGGLLLVVPGPNAPATPNTPATDAPTISGTARVGETLTADTTGISDGDGLGNATFAYQWLADAAEINGATASTYTLVAADAGKAIKVRVSFTDDAGNIEELTSAATGAVAAAPPPPNTPATDAPTITGAAQVGETLTAGATGISDSDGLGNATFAYQWLADAAEINGATASTYTLVAADAGKAIKVRVSFTDDAGNIEELTSAATGAVAAAPPPPNTPATGAPTITGTAQVGETLTAGATGISDSDGLGNATFAYQWLADAAEINGATASTYTLVAADAGKAIKVRVSFTDDAGNDEELTSAATGAVAAAVVNSPLTASAHDVPSSHDGSTTFTFELRFSEEPKADFSYTTVRDHAFTVTGGSVTYVRRLEPGKNVRWEITVTPGSSADVAIALNATTDCEADGAICTDDDRKLTNRLELTVNGPEPASLPPPTNLTATVNSDGHIVLSWTAPDDGSTTGYRILRRRPTLGEDGLLEYVANTQSTAVTFTDTDVTPGVQHVYRVQAISAAGRSQRSNYVNVTP